MPVIPFLAAARSFLGKIPREVWYALAILAALWLGHGWHERKIADVAAAAEQKGRTEQAAADAKAYTEAAIAAADALTAQNDRLKLKQASINERTVDALKARNDDIGRRYDDLRMRWAAHAAAEADSGVSGQAGADAVPGAAARNDAAACAAAGWVSLDVAAAAAEAADRAIAKDDRWIAWVNAQRAAWPK